MAHVGHDWSGPSGAGCHIRVVRIDVQVTSNSTWNDEELMTTTARHDAWSAGEHYERYMGRWSRQIATRYLDWLEAPKDAAWLDVGCGTGALTQSILARCNPRSIVAIDPSANFVAHARAAISDEHVRMRFEVADAQ